MKVRSVISRVRTWRRRSVPFFADVRKNEEKLNKVVAAINDMPLENELTDEQLDTYWRTCYNASLDCEMEKHKRGL